MKHQAIDTNVLLRYLVEDPKTIEPKFKGVYSFFAKLETAQLTVELLEIVFFQTYFVLTSFYKVPSAEAAEKLQRIVAFKGLHMASKAIVLECLNRLRSEKLDMVDAYILAWSKQKGASGVYSFDRDLKKRGLELLKVK